MIVYTTGITMNPKIIYKQNPLESQVILNEDEKRELFLRLKIWCLEDHLTDIEMCIKKDPANITRALEYCRMENYGDEEAKDMMDRWVLDALMDTHAGDCICHPHTCSKCFAEDLIGVYTIPGLHKHEAGKINYIFRENPGITIDEVIIKLDAEPSKEMMDRFPEHVERWKQERINAQKWLTNYKAKHL